MAISSAIIKFQPSEEAQVREELAALPTVSVEAQAPNGDFVVVVEGPDLDKMQSTCLAISKLPGVLSVDPSYVTMADETHDN